MSLKTWTRGSLTYTVDTHGHDTGGDFILRRNGWVLLQTSLEDLSASVSVNWAPNDGAFAITWSDGGALGNFHVRTFAIDAAGVHEIPGAQNAIADFQSRHHCASRGDNIQAYRWDAPNRLVLVASVYPTGDCGLDAGHTEGYIVQASDGAIVSHLKLAALRKYMSVNPQ